MPLPKDILNLTGHRPWELPTSAWAYYQEWNRALFAHWRVPAALLEPLIPKNTSLDLFDGSAWISLVAFTMEKVRPAWLPAWSLISTFHEINVRTYVTADNKAGVFFLNMEAGKPLSVWTARNMSGLPYENAFIRRHTNDKEHIYTSINQSKNFELDARFRIGQPLKEKTPLDIFLTERYCAYLENGSCLYRYDVHHKPWNLYEVEMVNLQTNYRIGNINLHQAPDLTQYSDGVQVLTWKRDQVCNLTQTMK